MSVRSAERVLQAERAALAARAQFRGTLAEAQRWLSPEQLFAEATAQVRARSLSVTGQAVESLRSRPVLSTLAATAIGLLLNHRSEIFAILRMILRGRRATSKATKHSARHDTPARKIEET